MARLVERLHPVITERVPLAEANGRVLAEQVITDRPSPPCDVSSMDGYAVRLADLRPGRLSVASEVAIGSMPPTMTPAAATRIFTGGALPVGADAVIKREDVQELRDAIELPPTIKARAGMNIRRRGENAPAGEVVAQAGMLVTPVVVAALATFGIATPLVYRRVRVAVITTGNELLPVEAKPSPTQIRDSNGPGLGALLRCARWIEVIAVRHVLDQPAALKSALEVAFSDSDAVVFTGGVSMGDYDYVPQTIESAGGEILFHKVSQRPGKPMLGAIGPAGQLILGLPGNPVSTMITMRRWGSVALRKFGGFGVADPAPGAVHAIMPEGDRLSMWWHRPVRLTAPGKAEIVRSMGSGDLISMAKSDGFIEVPPDASGPGPWAFYPWGI
jgi:molybdopterin molybdotransferase